VEEWPTSSPTRAWPLTSAAAAGEPGPLEEVRKGYEAGGKAPKAHLDGHNLVQCFRAEVKGPPRQELLHWGGGGDLTAASRARSRIA
jgi:hypothetical protein